MANVAAAQAALDLIEGILRRRYHYPHPIFEHVAAARAALEEPDVAAVVHPEQPVSEPETVTTSTADAMPEPESGTEGPAAPKARRPRKARR